MDQHPSNWFFYVIFLPAFMMCMLSYYSAAHSQPQMASQTPPPAAPHTLATASAPHANACIPFPRLRANLAAKDHARALEALHLALSQTGDGGTYVWERPERFLRGTITPTASFRDARGRICRHVVYSLSLGPHTRRTEGIACRNRALRWVLGG